MRPLLLSLLCLPLAAGAQSFAPVGAQWTYTQGNFGGPDSTIAVLQVLSDTVIQGRTYSHVTATEGWFICYDVLHYLGTSNDSTYYFNEAEQRPHLLFRWDAVPGDTWSTPISQGGVADTLDWVVSDTGHVIVGEQVLRTLTVGQTSRQGALICPLGGVVTEQLGGNTPFTWVYDACDAETYNGLRCYEENIFPMPEPPPPLPISWLNPQYPQCALSTGVGELVRGPWIQLSPNPAVAGEPVMIRLQGPVPANAVVEVFSPEGRLVQRQSVNAPSEMLELDAPGAYLIGITEGGHRVAVQRLIVQ